METVNYKCPNCAAPLEFSIEKQGWDCHYCGSYFSKEQISSVNTNLQPEASAVAAPPEVVWNPEQFQEDEMTAYSCSDCGGRIIAPKNVVTSFCPYCHNPAIFASQLQGDLRPARIIPFKVTKEQALETIHKACQLKPLLPKFFKDCVKNGEITGLYAPYWLFSAQFDSHYLIEGTKKTQWSDSKYHYTKTEIFHINCDGNVPMQDVPLDASRRLDDNMMEVIEPFHYQELQPFQMQYLSGFLAESFDVNVEDRKPHFLQRGTSEIERMAMNSAGMFPIKRILNRNVTPKEINQQYAMFPIWTISVKHRGRIYAYYVNGQTGKGTGKLPYSWGRFFTIFLGGAVLLSTIILTFMFATGRYFL